MHQRKEAPPVVQVPQQSLSELPSAGLGEPGLVDHRVACTVMPVPRAMCHRGKHGVRKVKGLPCPNPPHTVYQQVLFQDLPLHFLQTVAVFDEGLRELHVLACCHLFNFAVKDHVERVLGHGVVLFLLRFRPVRVNPLQVWMSDVKLRIVHAEVMVVVFFKAGVKDFMWTVIKEERAFTRALVVDHDVRHADVEGVKICCCC